MYNLNYSEFVLDVFLIENLEWKWTFVGMIVFDRLVWSVEKAIYIILYFLHDILINVGKWSTELS